MKRYQLAIPANINLAPALRIIALCIFGECGFEGNTLSHLQLIFDELFMNSVRYGSTEGSSIHITFEFDDGVLRVLLEDEGGEKKISAEELKKIITTEKSNENLGKKSGRGLAQIASRWADNLQVHDGTKGGICMVFTKKLSDAGEMSPTPPIEPSSLNIPDKNLSPEIIPISGDIDDVTFGETVQPVDLFIDDLEDKVLLILDFKELDFCNSTFLAKVAEWKQKMTQIHGDIAIQNISEKIFEIFDLVGMTKMIYITPHEFQHEKENS